MEGAGVEAKAKVVSMGKVGSMEISMGKVGTMGNMDMHSARKKKLPTI